MFWGITLTLFGIFFLFWSLALLCHKGIQFAIFIFVPCALFLAFGIPMLLKAGVC